MKNDWQLYFLLLPSSSQKSVLIIHGCAYANELRGARTCQPYFTLLCDFIVLMRYSGYVCI